MSGHFDFEERPCRKVSPGINQKQVKKIAQNIYIFLNKVGLGYIN